MCFFFLSFPFFIIFRFSVFGGPSWVAAVSLFLRLTTSSMTFFFRFSCCARHIERHTHKYRWEDSIRNRSHLPRRRCICSPPPPLHLCNTLEFLLFWRRLLMARLMIGAKQKNENKNKQTNKQEEEEVIIKVQRSTADSSEPQKVRWARNRFLIAVHI